MRFQLVKMTKDIAWVLDGETGKVYRTLIEDLAGANIAVLPAVHVKPVQHTYTVREEDLGVADSAPIAPVRPAAPTGPTRLANGAIVPDILKENPEAYGRHTSPRPRSIVPAGMGLEGVNIPNDQPGAAVETRRV